MTANSPVRLDHFKVPPRQRVVREEEADRPKFMLLLSLLSVPELSLRRAIGRRVEDLTDAEEDHQVHDRDQLCRHREEHVHEEESG